MPYKNLVIQSTNYNSSQSIARKHLYKGFSTNLTLDGSPKIYDFDLIKQDIINHFSTRKGERVMNPEFGTIIWDLIMEPLTEEVTNLLSNDINTICSYDPRVSPLEIKINEYDKGYLVEITLLMKNTNEVDTMRLRFDQNVGLISQ